MLLGFRLPSTSVQQTQPCARSSLACVELLRNVEVAQMAAEPEPDLVAATVDKAEEPLHNKKLQKLQKQYERRGIIYVSRIPPHMVRTSL